MDVDKLKAAHGVDSENGGEGITLASILEKISHLDETFRKKKDLEGYLRELEEFQTTILQGTDWISIKSKQELTRHFLKHGVVSFGKDSREYAEGTWASMSASRKVYGKYGVKLDHPFIVVRTEDSRYLSMGFFNIDSLRVTSNGNPRNLAKIFAESNVAKANVLNREADLRAREHFKELAQELKDAFDLDLQI